ncbi:hypothetical protein HPP92_010477 [Vanilla planifolia]|uniref:Glutamate receptor n=1 Tax=Vanilla planifolia TaxID=51239 RepID=A0A835UXK5_VANPL|nr:hypothetical protein HPP92_010477 [Vanilla planifolia]
MDTGERNRGYHLLYLLPSILFFSLLLGTRAQTGGADQIIPFDVGVVLEMDSWIGNISWSCMKMAVDDFYKVNSGYSTRLSLHLRDSGDDAFGAAVAAIDLLKNVKVKAIIGPQRSPQASFIIELGEEAHVPIMSSSAKSPLLSSTQSTYFIRTADSDSTQAKVIASLVQAFNWRQVVPIYVNDEYGNGILPYLINAFQAIDINVPYKSSISPLASIDEIQEKLYELKKMQTRVFIVHMTYDLGLRLFTVAKEEGMLSEGYVWITTYGLTDIVDLMGSSATNVMQGVLGIKPFVNTTNKLRDFSQRWQKIFHKENPNALVTQPTVFGLWAYDTVWSLALAVEKVKMYNFTFEVPDIHNISSEIDSIGISSSGIKLLRSIQNTEFDGMVGKFHLINGQLDSRDFEILNVVGNGNKRIGLWTPHVISGWKNLTGRLDTIIWPGGTKLVPKGWEWPIAGQILHIGIPVKPGFPQFVTVEEDRQTHVKIPSGYCIDVFKEVMKDLPYAPYNFTFYEDKHGNMNGTYDDLVYQVYLHNFDAVVGDVTIIANRSLYVDFTLPYTESGVSMLVPVKDKREKGAWAFLDPLTTDLWLASGAFFIFTGFVVWFLEHRINLEFRGAPAEQVGTVLYFSFSTLVFAYRERMLSNLSRVVVVVWLFVVMIMQSSYTASLTSILTVEQLQPTVTDVNDLIKNGDKVGYLTDSFVPSFLKRLNFKETNLIAYNSPEDYEAALSNGSVVAIFDEIPYLKVFLNKYCGKYAMVGPTYKTDGFGFVFPRGSPLAPEVSRSILKLLESDKMVDIEKNLYQNMSCPIEEEDDTNSSSLSFHSFWGLFLITGVASMTALLLYLVRFLYRCREVLRTLEPGCSTWRKIVFLAKLYDQRDFFHRPNSHIAKEQGPIASHDITPSAAATSGAQTPSSISNLAFESFESEEEIDNDLSSEEEHTGREISRQNPEPPSFADFLTNREQNDP